MDPATLEAEALRLPKEERAKLANRLLESISPVPPKLTEAWIREVESRMQALREVKITSVDAPKALAELRARLAQ